MPTAVDDERGGQRGQLLYELTPFKVSCEDHNVFMTNVLLRKRIFRDRIVGESDDCRTEMQREKKTLL